MSRIISRYENRRMYDNVSHKFITMNDLRELIRLGIEFKVIESVTNRDVTKERLLRLLIIRDDILTINILREIVLSHDGNFKAKLSLMLTKTIKTFSEDRYKYLLK